MINESSYSDRRASLFFQRLRRVVRDHEAPHVRLVPTLPSDAPAGVLLRTDTSRDLFMGNGPGRPLSRFTATQ